MITINGSSSTQSLLVLQEKTVVAAAMEKCKDRAAVNFTLAEKLNKLIGA